MSSTLVLGQEGVEVGADMGGVPFLGADDFAGDFAVAVHDVGLGNHGGTIREGDWRAAILSAGITVIGEGYGLVDGELGEGVGIFGGSYAEGKAVAGLGVFVKAGQGRGFRDAGGAPTGPEIEDDGVYAEIGQIAG